MKRAIPFIIPPLAFGLTAVLAWLTGTPANVGTVLTDPASLDPGPRASARGTVDDPSELIAGLERKILYSPAAPRGDPDWAGLIDPDRSGDDPLDDKASATGWSNDWAREAPDEMFAWLIHKPTPSPGRSMIPAQVLFTRWAEKDMPGALAALATIPDPGIRAQALMASLEVLCKNDPTRARDLLVENLNLFDPVHAAPVFDRSESGESTCALLLSLPPGSSRAILLAALLKGMAGNDLDHGRSAAHAVWEQAPQDLRHDLVAAGFSSDSDEAVVFTGLEELMREQAEASGDPVIADKFINAQGIRWVQRDPAGALEWAQTHLLGRSRAECNEWLFETAAGVDFAAALDACERLPDGMRRIRAAEAIARGASEERKAEAEEVVQRLVKGDP
jgi:hypothetical protein